MTSAFAQFLESLPIVLRGKWFYIPEARRTDRMRAKYLALVTAIEDLEREAFYETQFDTQ